MNANMAQCKLPKDVFALAETFLEVFVIGNKPYHLVRPLPVCLYLFDDIPSHKCGL